MGPPVGNGGRIGIGLGSERARPGGGLRTARASVSPRSFETDGLRGRVLEAVLNGDRIPARALAAKLAAFSGENVSESSLGSSSSGVIPPGIMLETRDAVMAEEWAKVVVSKAPTAAPKVAPTVVLLCSAAVSCCWIAVICC